jgi:hypothetical protein
MNAFEFITESAVDELVKKLPSLEKHNYSTIDSVVRRVAAKHRINRNLLSDLFARKYKSTPDEWIKNKLDEEGTVDTDIAQEVEKFIEWASDVLHVQSKPNFELSMDTNQAQDGHHTGAHSPDSNHVWVYVNNRNLVDILRTVFHELVHVRQGELGMIQPGDSYPGSPIEAMADMLAGKYIKIYGEKNHHIFQ